MRKTKIILACLFIISAVIHPFAVKAAQHGDLVKGSGSAVYYVGPNNTRYVFTNQNVYHSWYDDFSTVATISDAEITALTLAGNVTYKHGTRLLKLPSFSTVYAVEPNGVLRAIPNQETAVALYGNNWSELIDDLPDAFFTDYNIGSNLNRYEHPEGTLFKYEGEYGYYILQRIDGTLKARPIASNLVKDKFAITIPKGFNYFLESNLATDPFADIVEKSSAPVVREPAVNLPPPGPATLKAALPSDLSSTLKSVVGVEDSKLFALNLIGDSTHQINVDQITFYAAIDATFDTPDFQIDYDVDDDIIWRASDVIRDIQIRNANTHEVYDTVATVESGGKIQTDKTIVIAPGATLPLEIVGKVTTAPEANTRMAIQITPSSDITVSSPSATGISITPTTTLNPAGRPSKIIFPKVRGSIMLTSASDYENSFQPLGQDMKIYKINFYAFGEGFYLRQFKIQATDEGKDLLGLEHLRIDYIDSLGKEKTVDYKTKSENVFEFSNLDIYVKKGMITEIPFTVKITDLPVAYSDSRLQLKFITDGFLAVPDHSGFDIVGGDFAETSIANNITKNSPLIIFRDGSFSAQAHANTPSGTIEMYDQSRVLTFSITAHDGNVKIKQLTFKLESNDIATEAEVDAIVQEYDTDIFERMANISPKQLSSLYTYNADLDKRTKIYANDVNFYIYDKSAGVINQTPENLETGVGDYALLIYNFGTGLNIPKGATRSYDLVIDTTTATRDESAWLRVTFPGDEDDTLPAQANVLWDDGSGINATGYLIPGLDLIGNLLNISTS